MVKQGHKRLLSVVATLVLAACMALAPAVAQALEVSVAVVGPNADGSEAVWVAPMTYEVADGDDGWTISQQAFDEAGLTYASEDSDYGAYLVSITSPVDGSVLAYDEATGAYWQLWYGGQMAQVGASGLELADGGQIVWRYAADDAFDEAILDTAQVTAEADGDDDTATADDVAASDVTQDDASEDAATETTDEDGSAPGMAIGIGAAVFVVAIVLVMLVRNKK